MKGFTNNRTLIAFGLALFMVVALWLAVPLNAFLTDNALAVLITSYPEDKSTDFSLVIWFNKTSDEIINTVSGRLAYFEDFEDIPNTMKYYPAFPGEAVYATHCYNEEGEINMTGAGTIYESGYGFYGYGTDDYGYGYDYGYGFDVEGDFYCEFTFEELPDGVYFGMFSYINDNIIDISQFGESGQVAIVLQSLEGEGIDYEEIDEETIEMIDEFVYELANSETGETPMWFTIPNGTTIYSEGGYMTTFLTWASPPSEDPITAEDLLDGGAIGSLFAFAPSGIQFDPYVEVCVQYNVSDSVLWTIWDTQEEMDTQLQEWEDSGLLYFLSCTDDEICEEVDIILDTEARTMCAQIDHFSTGTPMKEAEEDEPSSNSPGGSGGAPVGKKTIIEEEEEIIEETEVIEENEEEQQVPIINQTIKPPNENTDNKTTQTTNTQPNKQEEKGDSLLTTVISAILLLIVAAGIYIYFNKPRKRKGL